MKIDSKLSRTLGSKPILGAIGTLLALCPLGVQAQTQSIWSGASGNNNWQTPGNWSSNSLAAEFNKNIGNRRINVTGTSADISSPRTLIYSAAEGTTSLSSSTLGLVIGTGSGGSADFDGAMRVTGGSFTAGSTSTNVAHGHLIGNARNGSLSVEGGSLTVTNNAAGAMFLTYGTQTNTTATISVSGGTATFDTIAFGRAGSTGSGTGNKQIVNLNGGTFAIRNFIDNSPTAYATSTINLNGGTLQARADQTNFITTTEGPPILNVRNGGAVIDTNSFNITINQGLSHSNIVGDNTVDGGLIKNGAGTLTLSGVSTYTGNTTVNEGTLELTSAGESLFKIRNGDVTNTIGGSGTVYLDGLFRIDVSELSSSTGTWNLVDVDSLDEDFGGTFGLAFVGGPDFTTGDDITYSSGEYTFSTATGNLTRAGAATPEIDIVRGASPIANEGVDTVASSAAATPVTLTYAISNPGEATLSITGAVALADETNCLAEVTTQPAATINPTTSDNLVVTVTPDSIGPWSFTVSVPNNDANENPYNWTVSGNAIQFEQDLNITRGAATIWNYSTDSISGTFGGLPANLTYTLANAGFTSLAITGSVTVSDQNNVAASVTTQPGATITSGATSPLAVSFTPAAPGAWSFKLTVPNDDPYDNPFAWTVSGSAALYAPEIGVTRATLAIPVGSTDPVARNMAGNPTTLTYQLANTGTAPLTITGSVAVSATSNCAATVTTPPAASINPAGSSSMIVSVTPGAAGAWSFNLSVPNDDADENPYTWTVIGNAGAASGATTIFHETFQDGTGEVYMARSAFGTLENVLKPGEVEDPSAAREVKFTSTGTNSDQRILARPFAAQALVNNGDRLRLSYKLRINGDYWTLLRTGLFNVTSLPEAYAWGHDWNNTFANNNAFGLAARTPAVVNAGYYTFLRDNSFDPSNARRVEARNWATTGDAPTVSTGADLNTQSIQYNIDGTNTITYQVVYEIERVSSGEIKTLMTLSSTDEFDVTTVHMTVPGTHTGTVVTDFNGAFVQTNSNGTPGATELYLDDLKLERFTGAEPPSLAVTRAANPVADGGSDAVGGSQPAIATTLTYTLTNSGAGALSVGAPVSITSQVNCSATVTTPPPSQIVGSGGTSSLVVSVTPADAGPWSFGISFTNSDTASNPYNWTVSGNASASGSPYDDWAADNGLAGPDADRNATPFDDGVANLLKFGFNMNGSGPDVSVLVPGSGTAGLPVWTLVGSGPARVLQVEYISRKGASLSYFPEVSSTLSGAFTPMSGAPSISYIDPTFDRVIITHPADPAVSPKLFGRVRIVDSE